MNRARSRTSRQRFLAALCALGTGLLGIVFFSVGAETPSAYIPLAFHLDERPPATSGIDFQHTKGAFHHDFDGVYPFLAAVSAAGCVTDVDNDGLLDVLLLTAGQGKQNKLFLNEGHFHFHRDLQPAMDNLNSGPFSSDCTFADVNNDGFDDVLILAIGQAPRLFQNTTRPGGGRMFVDITKGTQLPEFTNAFGASFFDVDNDGDLDLFLADYFRGRYDPKDVPGAPFMRNLDIPEGVPGRGRFMPNNWGAATNGGDKYFLLGDGTGHFVRQDLAKWGFSEKRFTFDIGTADINLDGFTDLYLANDFGPDQLYLNRGDGFFVDVKGRFPTEIGRDSFKGMNADIADIDNDGYPEIYVSNVFHPVLPEGTLLWKNEPDPSGDPFMRHFTNIAASAGVRDGGWGWGAKFVDIDLDGDTDILATNGYISQNPDKDWWYRASRLVAGSGDIIADALKWPPFDDASMCGQQTSHMFINDGNRFHNRAADAGINRWFDGRGVLIADFDVDGRPDVMILPQGQPYFLARNEFVATKAVPKPPHFVGLHLHGDGRRVNKKAVGVRVRISPSQPNADQAFKPLYREVSAGNGMSGQSMDWVLAGLGAYTGDVDVWIHWTDGLEETRRGLKADQYHDLAYPNITALRMTP